VRIVDYVTDVAWVAAQLPRSPIVIGHSMGGFVVQKYLERHSAPAGMLLASVPPSGILRTVLRLARRHPNAFAKAISSVSLLPIVSTPALARDAFFSDDLGEEEVAAYSARLQDESFLAFFDMLAFDLPQPKRVTTPVFVFGGENDSLFYPDDIKATARAYGRRAQILPGVAHDMMLETKWREVAQCILNALNEVLRDS
jgi:pimeloyl-ACP methyl ester carboxylesterase